VFLSSWHLEPQAAHLVLAKVQDLQRPVEVVRLEVL
jgi:hypothetical protein